MKFDDLVNQRLHTEGRYSNPQDPDFDHSGSGTAPHNVSLAPKMPSKNIKRCPECGGDGQVNSEECPRCSGSGIIKEDLPAENSVQLTYEPDLENLMDRAYEQYERGGRGGATLIV